MSHIFNNNYVQCHVFIQGDQVVLQGNVIGLSEFEYVEIVAANPIDRMQSYSGSGLPFPCANIAFENTPNYKKITNDDGGEFRLFFLYPNSYYTEDGITRVPPCIFFVMYKTEKSDPIYIRFELPPMDPILNLRTLTYRDKPKKGPETYNLKQDVVGICGAEETMRRYSHAKMYMDLA